MISLILKEIDLPSELQRIKEKGWIPSMRKSDTGIGKTIEELLGIRENNNKIADCSYQGMEVEITNISKLYSNILQIREI